MSRPDGDLCALAHRGSLCAPSHRKFLKEGHTPVQFPMRLHLPPALLASLFLLLPWSAAQGGLFSATGNVIALLAGELYVGEAIGHLNGAGTIAIRSQKTPHVTCIGQFTSSALRGGTGQMRCTDGATATFQFKRLTIYRGHGTGEFSRGSMNFAYGLDADQALPYLTLPVGKRLRHDGIELTLADL